MTEETKHTPTPWETPGVNPDGRMISVKVNGKRRAIATVYSPEDRSEDERDANGYFIVKACNAYDKHLEVIRGLVEAVKENLRSWEQAAFWAERSQQGLGAVVKSPHIIKMNQLNKEALAKAEEALK